MNEKGNLKLIKTINEIRLLNLIKEEGPISRNELAIRTKFSKVTVSDIINRLNKNGFILETGKGESTKKGGKRPILLKLNPENGYVIGIQIKRNHTTIALANLESNVQGIEQFSYSEGAAIDDVVPTIYDKIDLLLKINNVKREKLISIGIGIPGFVDYTKGELKFGVTLRGWTNLPLASRFSKRYNIPAIIENDVNIITLSESLLGAGRGKSSLVCIWISDGIGAGIIVDGQIVRGETGNVGEIGYLELGNYLSDFNRLKNLYNNQRYFGEILSEANLFDTLKMKLQSDVNNSNKNHENSTLQQMLISGDKGNAVVREILNEYAYPLSIICMNFIKSLNPGLIILSGQVIENSNYLFKKVKQLAKQSMINIPLKSSSIVVGELKDRVGVKGAIVMALKTVFEPPVKKSNIFMNNF